MAIDINQTNTFMGICMSKLNTTLENHGLTDVWCQTADLLDMDYSGPAILNIDNEQVVLSDDQWRSLHHDLDEAMTRDVWSSIIEYEEMIH